MTIEEAIRAKLLTMSAVTAITSTIRPDELSQKDVAPGQAAIIISVEDEEFDNDLSGTTNLVAARVIVSTVSGKRSMARSLAEAVRANGTNPGTGLAGCTVTTGSLLFQAMLEKRSAGFVANDDGSESGYYSVDSVYYCTFTQAP